jgi:hypothetical protein
MAIETIHIREIKITGSFASEIIQVALARSVHHFGSCSHLDIW